MNQEVEAGQIWRGNQRDGFLEADVLRANQSRVPGPVPGKLSDSSLAPGNPNRANEVM